jgi:hypothetical protein
MTRPVAARRSDKNYVPAKLLSNSAGFIKRFCFSLEAA